MSAIHATAVAIAGEGLVIHGPSRSGKSRLAFALIARTTRRRRIVLIGDDRILLRRQTRHLVAAPHPRIAGFIERRGLGLVAMPWSDRAPVHGLVELGMSPPEPLLAEVPCLAMAISRDAEADAAFVLSWWTSRGAACGLHPAPTGAEAIR